MKSLAYQINEHLITVTGSNLADLGKKDIFGNKFNLTIFVALVAFSASFFLLFCIGKWKI